MKDILLYGKERSEEKQNFIEIYMKVCHLFPESGSQRYWILKITAFKTLKGCYLFSCHLIPQTLPFQFIRNLPFCATISGP